MKLSVLFLMLALILSMALGLASPTGFSGLGREGGDEAGRFRQGYGREGGGREGGRG